MMKKYRKQHYDVANIRRLLERGPVVRAHVATTPRLPKTLHYRGDGEFMVSGREIATLERYPNQRR